ncbi:unnamed protein product [Pieris macdunnoughi]|uniref:Reverse transcriptase domain-containing protein n=1 Tax=Pieris macdunnoughi TaxID=345717 RepID=A0A821QSW8_9NEOP|nr:unnamed protein product [Pieris macdunnoughi]
MERCALFWKSNKFGNHGRQRDPCGFSFFASTSHDETQLQLESNQDYDIFERGGRALAVSLDIANAFNSLPFGVIREALEFFGVPLYLRRIVGSYLEGRQVAVVNGQGEIVRHPVLCGVPQGSVLGPFLWNISYDWVLRGALLPGMRLFCYADDTLVVASGGSFGEVAQLAMAGTRLVVGRIQALGLRVSLDKTEALLFHGPRMGPPSGAALVVEGVRISVASSMKYLGLVLDGRWNFEPHFKSLEGRLVRAAGALGKLLPNLGGPCQSVRRLYCGIIRSMALYGAPIWDDALIRRTNRTPVHTTGQRLSGPRD